METEPRPGMEWNEDEVRNASQRLRAGLECRCAAAWNFSVIGSLVREFPPPKVRLPDFPPFRQRLALLRCRSQGLRG